MSGLIHLYCGEGKGKTTAAMGLALRAAGAGRRVLVLQFFKDGRSSEVQALNSFPDVEIVSHKKRFGFFWTLSDEERAQAREYYSALLEEVMAKSGDYDLLVLDEAMSACTNGVICEERLRQLLAEKPEALEVVLTGRDPSQAMVDQADYVTEMRKIKHPFDRGIPARLGVEY